jgi:hypothetical protein
MFKVSHNGPRKVVLARGRGPIQPSEGHYDLTEDI